MAMDLASQIAQALTEYSDEIATEVDKAAKEVATETVAELRATSPKSNRKNRRRYAESWTKKQISNGQWVVHVKAPNYRLTHLLERGHVKANGGRTRAFPHIAPAEEHAVEKFEERIRRLGQ